MPDNTLPGELEDFIRFLVPPTDLNWPYAKTSVDGIPVKPTPLTHNWTSKAEIHTWLAWQNEPGKPIGQAITKRYLSADVEQAQHLMAWIRRLFKWESE